MEWDEIVIPIIIVCVIIGGVWGLVYSLNSLAYVARESYDNSTFNAEEKCSTFCEPKSYYFEYNLIGSDVCLCKEEK